MQQLAEQTARFQVERDELTQQRRDVEAQRAQLEELAIEQSEQLARIERETAEEQDAVAVESGTVDEPVMGQSFEHVDPVLLGEPSLSAATARDAGDPRAAYDPMPVDPAADEAYEKLVDRLVQFNYSKKKPWYKFW